MPGNADARAKKLTLGGAVLAAIAASSCCIGPLVLAALGIGGAGMFATLGSYRWYILAVTALLLAAGFYLTYRRPRVAAADACECEGQAPKAKRAARLGLWIATGLVVTSAAAPVLLAAVTRQAPVPVAPGQHVEQAVLWAQGMDCDSCAAPIRMALTKVGGFHDLKLDLKAHMISVTFEPAPGRLQAYVAAINELGFEASLSPGGG